MHLNLPNWANLKLTTCSLELKFVRVTSGEIAVCISKLIDCHGKLNYSSLQDYPIEKST